MKLFLVPASEVNLKATVVGRVDIAVAERFLTSSRLKSLESALGGKKAFHCWAVTESLRSTFDHMERGDVVLLTVKGTGRFGYFARIVHKVESEGLGNHLWEYTPGKPWKLIYMLGSITEVSIDKSALVSALGYQANDMVAGTRRVRHDYLAKIVERYGSLQKFLESIAGMQLPFGRETAAPSAKTKDDGDWSDEEEAQAVRDYVRMLIKELRGEGYSKTQYRKALPPNLKGRPESAIELKFQNISAALINKNFPYVPGYPPRGPYQARLDEIIDREIESQPGLVGLINQSAGGGRAGRSAVVNWEGVAEEPPKRVQRTPEEIRPKRLYRGRKYDFARKEAQNRELGEQGEEFVVRFEKERLSNAGRADLAGKIERVSVTKGDGAGYDVHSFEVDGSDRLIEVKTSNFGKSFPFFISANELEFSIDHSGNYYLYRVFNFKDSPKLFMLHGSLERKCSLTPTMFKATFN